MFIARTTTLAASALLLFSLAACSPPGAASTGDDSTGDESTGAESGDTGGAGGAGAGDCLTGRTWVLDLDDAASQVGTTLGSSGLTVTQAEGAGRQDFRFAEDGTVTSHIDVTYTLTVVDGELNLTLIQTHSGDPSGEWERDGDSVTFPSWDNAGYSVQSQTIVNGTASENSTTVPDDTLGNGSVMSVDCSGDTLTTSVTGSPYTHHWTAEG